MDSGFTAMQSGGLFRWVFLCMMGSPGLQCFLHSIRSVFEINVRKQCFKIKRAAVSSYGSTAAEQESFRSEDGSAGRGGLAGKGISDDVSDYRETGISMVCGTTVSVYRMGVGENAIFGLYEWKCRGNCAGCRIVSLAQSSKYLELSAQIEAKLWTHARKMEAGAGFSDEGEMPLAGMAHGNSGFLMAYAALLKMLEQAGI